AGEHWANGCVQSAVLQLPARRSKPSDALAMREAAEPAAPPALMPEAPPAASRLLAEQNDLFAEAMAARKSGRLERALSLYAELVSRLPSGPLAESASVERVRTLRRTDGARARLEAARYLERFPNGFARAEMEALNVER